MKLVAFRLVQKVTDCMQIDYPLQCKQEHSTCSYPQPDESNPCPPLIYVRSNLTLFCIYAWVFQMTSLLQVSPPEPRMYIFFSHKCHTFRLSRHRCFVFGEKYTCSAHRIWWAAHVFSMSYLL